MIKNDCKKICIPKTLVFFRFYVRSGVRSTDPSFTTRVCTKIKHFPKIEYYIYIIATKFVPDMPICPVTCRVTRKTLPCLSGRVVQMNSHAGIRGSASDQPRVRQFYVFFSRFFYVNLSKYYVSIMF